MIRRPIPAEPPANGEVVERKIILCAQGKRRQPKNKPSKEEWRGPFVSVYKSMMPRLTPIIAAWVRSFAPSFDMILRTRPLTVSSVTES